MTPIEISTAANNAIQAFGSTAHSAITAYREGGTRLGQVAGQRWSRSFKQASPKLKPETRKNAAHAQKVFGSYYSRGLQLSATGAEVAVETMVQVAANAVERAAAFAQGRAGKAV